MVDCELIFKCGRYDIMECFQKSFLYNEDFPSEFKSENVQEIKQYIKDIMINAIKTENNYFGDEYNLFAELLGFIVSLEYQKLDKDIKIYCEITSR